MREAHLLPVTEALPNCRATAPTKLCGASHVVADVHRENATRELLRSSNV